MKRNKVLKIVAIVLATVFMLLIIAALGMFFYVRHLVNNLPETLAETDDAAMAQVTLTDEELDQLLSGEITLTNLGTVLKADAAAVENTSASTAESASAATASVDTTVDADSRSEANSSSVGADASSSGSVGTSSAGDSSAQAAGSTKTEQPYEAEIKELLRQLYAVKARAEAELNSCIAGAKAEYKALPASQQTQARKVSIVLSRSAKLYSMQAAYDKEVNNIVSQMRSILTANGQSTELADQALAYYNAQKNATYSQLMAKLYS